MSRERHGKKRDVKIVKMHRNRRPEKARMSRRDVKMNGYHGTSQTGVSPLDLAANELI
jgi:hypothetical protein